MNEPIISIKHLFKSYGDKLVLKDINLEAWPGQVIGYIGPNGAGKSTTVKILCGLLTDYEGSVTIKGLVTSFPPTTARSVILFSRIAVLPMIFTEVSCISAFL